MSGTSSPMSDGETMDLGAQDLLGRAAAFRLEAETLRARASEVTEAVIRDQYLALANRWTSLAAGLEAEALGRRS